MATNLSPLTGIATEGSLAQTGTPPLRLRPPSLGGPAPGTGAALPPLPPPPTPGADSTATPTPDATPETQDAGLPNFEGVAAKLEDSAAAGVELGRPFSLFIDVTHPKDTTVTPESNPSFTGFELVGVSSEAVKQPAVPGAAPNAGQAPETGDTPVTTRFTFTLQAMDTDLDRIGSVKFQKGDGSTVVSPPVPVRITVNLAAAETAGDGADTGGFVDVTPPIPVEVPDYRPMILLGVLGVIGLVALAFWLGRKFAGPKGARSGPPPLPTDPFAEAIAALATARARPLDTPDQIQQFYFETSNIVRAYLGRLFGLDATEMTTDEFLHATAGRALPGLRLVDVAKFLEDADVVKFSTYRPPMPAVTDMASLAEGFVRATEASARLRWVNELRAWSDAYGDLPPSLAALVPPTGAPRPTTGGGRS
jgi:hypothetical protein